VAADVVLRSCQLRAAVKGCGFIARADGPDVFVHYLGIDGYGFRSLEAAHPVEFEETQAPRRHWMVTRPRPRLRSAARPRTQAIQELRCFSSKVVGH